MWCWAEFDLNIELVTVAEMWSDTECDVSTEFDAETGFNFNTELNSVLWPLLIRVPASLTDEVVLNDRWCERLQSAFQWQQDSVIDTEGSLTAVWLFSLLWGCFFVMCARPQLIVWVTFREALIFDKKVEAVSSVRDNFIQSGSVLFHIDV